MLSSSRPLTLLLSAASFLAFGLACSGFERSVDNDDCGCSITVPLFFEEATELVPGSTTSLQVQKLISEQYLTVQVWQKAEQEPTSVLTALDSFVEDDRWSTPTTPASVEVLELDGWPALARRTWETLDNGVELASWQAVVDLPDRRIYVDAWTLADEPEKFDELVEIAKTLKLDAPPRDQKWSSFEGVTQILQRAESLPQARSGRVQEYIEVGRVPLPEPPPGFERVAYESEVGKLAAWLHSPASSADKPAVLLVSEAPNTIATEAAPFVEAGFTVLAPTLRGRHDNPGRRERLWGEIDDVLAARDFLAAQPGVDSKAIVFFGAYASGTAGILAATRSDGFAKVVVGASPVDVNELHERYPSGYDPTEYKITPEAHDLRSPLLFTDQLKSPVLYAWTEHGFPNAGPFRMERAALRSGAPFELLVLSTGNTGDLLPALASHTAERLASGNLAHPHTHEEEHQLAMRVRAMAKERVRERLIAWMDGELAAGFTSYARLEARAPTEGAEWIGPVGAKLAEELVIERIAAHKTAVASWPERTDIDRLSSAFAALNEAGIVAEEHYEDCSDCAWAAMRHLGGQRRDEGRIVTGYAYYSHEETREASDSGHLAVFFGGWGRDTEEVGQQIVAALAEQGLNPEWNGDAGSTIQLRLDYKRRPPP